MVYEPTDLAEYIAEKGGSRRDRPVIGVVQKVFVHDDPNDIDGAGVTPSNFEANVKTRDELEEFRRIPIHVERNGHIVVPQKGDVVEVAFNGRSDPRPYVSGFAYTDTVRPPIGREGHWRHRFGDSSPYLYVEAETSDHSAGHPDVVRLAKKSDGLSDPTTLVEIDDSGGSTVVNIHSEGDVSISADGNVTIDGIDFDQHTHDYEDDDGTSTTTKTTDAPQ